MIPYIKSGVSGFDELVNPDSDLGGIPENTSTLVYGPVKCGKSIFANQFLYHGLLNHEPCLYVATDHGVKEFEYDMNEFNFNIESYIDDNSLYIIDTISDISELKLTTSESIVFSHINNPSDIMIKVGSGVRYIYKKSQKFRSVLDSATTLLAYNDNMLIVRVLKAYLTRIREAGGTPIITYTADSADKIVETMLKSMVNNIIKMDGEELTVEAMKGVGKRTSPYTITDKGIVIK